LHAEQSLVVAIIAALLGFGGVAGSQARRSAPDEPVFRQNRHRVGSELGTEPQRYSSNCRNQKYEAI
jgi:Protein of unknown function (DUF1328)